MKIIITENQLNMLKFQRRLNFVQEYIDGLYEESNRDDVCKYWTKGESDEFINGRMGDLVSQLCDEIGNYDSYDDIYEYLVDNGYRSQLDDFFFDTTHNYCNKGEQKKHVIEKIMEEYGITYKIYYKKRGYFNGDQLDSVDIHFYTKDGDKSSYPIYFKTRGNKIISDPIIYGDMSTALKDFNYIPNDAISDYFSGKAKEFLEKYLPLEYPR